MSNLIDALHHRYATKAFDPAKKIEDDVMDRLMESLRLSPSSFGLQPWKFVMVTDDATKAELLPHSWNQGQVTSCDAHVVLCRRTDIDEEYVSTFIAQTAADQGVEIASLEEYKQMMLGFMARMTEDQKADWAARQVYIALGFLMLGAAHEGVDACPMEGIDTAKYDEILGLKEQNLATVVACPIGYRNADDPYANKPKTRFAAEDIFIQK